VLRTSSGVGFVGVGRDATLGAAVVDSYSRLRKRKGKDSPQRKYRTRIAPNQLSFLIFFALSLYQWVTTNKEGSIPTGRDQQDESC